MLIDAAATAPVSSALPMAVTHRPTASAEAVAVAVRVNVVDGDTVTVTTRGEDVPPEPSGRAASVTVNPDPFTDVTVPNAPKPPRSPFRPVVGPPEACPVAPSPWPFAPGVPEVPVPPRNPPARRPRSHLPFTATEIITLAAVTLAAGVDVGDPVAPCGGRIVTHTPEWMSFRLAATVSVNRVLADQVTAVCELASWTCSV
jgi:hypothetical protein